MTKIVVMIVEVMRTRQVMEEVTSHLPEEIFRHLLLLQVFQTRKGVDRELGLEEGHKTVEESGSTVQYSTVQSSPVQSSTAINYSTYNYMQFAGPGEELVHRVEEEEGEVCLIHPLLEDHLPPSGGEEEVQRLHER